ncbi:unnamed protein product [Linum trigynum]|uniref:Knl1 C-terminal RWD domain-containing protein n=1 Tax=Linum trigynum TaxID=586398 RepID=A0AAV2GB83_9ROSI
MASGPRTAERLCDSGTDEQTVALRKKRLRRVSFAEVEITSVHVFERDDYGETPPTDDGSTKNQTPEPENEVLGFFKELADGNDDLGESSFYGGDGEEEDVEDASARKSFLQPTESPGSSIFGSATSNDVDNFFGPVSSDFIRPRRLSDSGDSTDNNHEITMDSTAFSMHFRSLVRSESGDLSTPTKVGFGFGEKTLTSLASPSNPGSLMKLTMAKKLPVLTNTVDKSGGGGDTNAMSLVGDDAPSYDYGRLSPDLEAILGKGSKDFQCGSVTGYNSPNFSKRNETLLQPENGKGEFDQNDCGDKVLDRVGALDVSAERVILGDGASAAIRGEQNNGSHSPSRNELLLADISIRQPIQSPNHLTEVNTPDQLNQLQGGKCYTGAVSRLSTYADLPDPSPNKTSNDLKLSSSMKLECIKTCQGGTQKDEPSGDRRSNRYAERTDEDRLESLSAGLVPSLSVKQQNMFNHNAKSVSTLSLFTPSPKQPGAILANECIKSAEIFASVHKTSSRLKDSIEESKFLLSRINSSIPSVSVSPLNGDRKNVANAWTGVPVANLDKHFSIADTIGIREQDAGSMQNVPSGSFRSIVSSEKMENASSRVGSTDSILYMTPSRVLKENPAQTMPKPSEFSSPKIKVRHGSDATSITVHERVSPPPTNSAQKYLPYSEKSGSLPSHLKQQRVQLTNLAAVELVQDADLRGDAASDAQTSGITDKLESWFTERRESFSSPLLINRLDEGGYINEPSRIKSPCKEALTESQTLEEENMISSPHAEAVGGKNSKRQIGMQNSNSPDPAQEVQNGSARKRKVEVVQEDSPMSSRIKLDRIVSPYCNSGELVSNKGNTAFQISCSPVIASDVGGSYMCEKRNVEELKGATDKTSMVRSSPDTHVTNLTNPEAGVSFSNGCNGVEMIGGDTTMKHWRDISLELSTLMKDLLSPSVDALNIKSIDMLQDILDYLQKVKMRKMFLSQIQQKNCDQASKKVLERTAEMRNLICKLVFERARVQLMAVKRQKFLKKRQMLSIAVQESQMLKSAEVLCLPLPSIHSKDKVSSEKLVGLRLGFEALEGKLNTLTQHFRTEYKIGTEATCPMMIGMVNDQLKKRICYRHIYEGIQLYKVQDLENKNGILSIVLNYLDLFSQRLTITAARTPSLLLSTKLNEAKIRKKFPNMDACAAFAYVLNAEATTKYVGSRSLAQETRMASSILHNILDVVKEMQKAMIESINLVGATFSSASVERLDLQLSFVNVNSYAKVNLMLDMTCLKHGVYPSDIIPHRIQVSGTKKTDIESLSAQAKAAVDNLRVGYFRILGLCRCISQVMSQ